MRYYLVLCTRSKILICKTENEYIRKDIFRLKIAPSSGTKYKKSLRAQRVNLRVVGSSPTLGEMFLTGGSR